jgi:hypothetical protein
VAEQPVRAAPVMSWGGESLLGYVRVELMNEQALARPSIQVLVVCDANGKVFRYSGLMVALPSGVFPAPGSWHAFVRSPSDIESDRLTPAMVALVSPSGTLQLFAFTDNSLEDSAPLLRPIN